MRTMRFVRNLSFVVLCALLVVAQTPTRAADECDAPIAGLDCRPVPTPEMAEWACETQNWCEQECDNNSGACEEYTFEGLGGAQCSAGELVGTCYVSTGYCDCDDHCVF